MKKYLILCAGLIVLFVLLLCQAAAATPLTTDEIIARNGNITEKEKQEYLDSLDDVEDGYDLAIGPDYTLDGKTIRLSEMQLTVSDPGGSNPRTVYVPLENTYYEICDEVILLQERDANLFNGRPTAGMSIPLNSRINVVSDTNVLQEGSKLVILETDGGIHALYAGAGTDSDTLVIGKDLYIWKCFKDVQFHTPNGGVDIPISFVTIPFLDGSGYVSAGEDGALNINIDVDSDWSWWPPAYYLYLKDCSIGLKLPNLTIHIDRQLTFFSVEVPLVEIVEPLAYGFAIDMSPTLSLEGAGEGDTVLSMYGREGFYLTVVDMIAVTDIGWKHTEPEFSLIDTNMEGEIYYGISWGPALTWAEVAGFGGFYKQGVVVSAAKANNDFDPDDPKDTDWHVCGKDNCLEGTAYVREGPFSANIVLLDGMVSIPIISSDPWNNDPFAEYYISKTFDDKSMSSLCPHWAYRLDVNVEDLNGNPVPNASVYYKDVPKHYEEYSSATADANGHAALCTTTGKIVVTAELANPDDPSHPITASQTVDKKAEGESVTLKLDVPLKHVYFKNSQAGEATNWPNDIDFRPIISKDVTLPDTIPGLSGRQFTGWNTKQDGSGTAYAPGTKLTLEDDLTLWAQWKLTGDDWYVIYNANGGTKAPEPQIIQHGKDAVLTKEFPEGGKLIFKGWTPDPQAMDPVYQPGDTLPYDSGKNVVVLYALWNLSPVPQPIHISFEANGAQKASLPPDIWMAQGGWVQMKEAYAPYGTTYAFRGWSERPDAEEPDFLAGKSYYFYKDTVLYAIWDNLDTMTLTFRDSLPGAASGIPAPITILPSMSKYVQISDDIPQKGGRIFIGWNTEKDGSGTHYAPGSVITLWKDSVLWAQWKITGDDWYIIYNAHGGTKAPEPQIIARGKDAVLTKELPESETMTFKGWATDKGAVTPEYQPGATLPYDSGKNVVVLYAIWDMNPVERPVVVSFAANGGRTDTVPGNISTPSGVWTRLPAHQPSWDLQHDFLGWASDPNAATPEWTAGGLALFNKDTTLYAVWKAHYRVIEGAGSVWTKGSKKAQRFVADGAVKYFKDLRIDGKSINKDTQISSGSTIADIPAKTMETLSVGDHTVTFVYVDGEASAPFKVRKKAPPTGDTGHPVLWISLAVLGIAGLVLLRRRPHTAGKKK